MYNFIVVEFHHKSIQRVRLGARCCPNARLLMDSATNKTVPTKLKIKTQSMPLTHIYMCTHTFEEYFLCRETISDLDWANLDQKQKPHQALRYKLRVDTLNRYFCVSKLETL